MRESFTARRPTLKYSKFYKFTNRCRLNLRLRRRLSKRPNLTRLFKFAFSFCRPSLLTSYAKFTRLTALCTLCFFCLNFTALPSTPPPPSSIAATDLQILPPSAFKEFLYHFLITVFYPSGLVSIAQPKRAPGLRTQSVSEGLNQPRVVEFVDVCIVG